MSVLVRLRSAPGDRGWSARRRGESGSTSLELVVLFPAVLAFIFAIVQGALWYDARNVALSAAQQGVRAARADGGSADQGAQAARAFVSQAGGGGVLNDLQVDPTRTQVTATVTVSGTVPSVLPGIHFPRVSQTASGPVERFTQP